MKASNPCSLVVNYSVQNPPYGAVILSCISKYLQKSESSPVEFNLDNKLQNNEFSLNGNNLNEVELAKKLTTLLPYCDKLLDVPEYSELDYWLKVLLLEREKHLETKKAFFENVEYFEQMNNHLAHRTYLIGYRLSLSDVVHFSFLRSNCNVNSLKNKYPHLVRWYNFISNVPGTYECLKKYDAPARVQYKKPFTKQEQQDNSYKGVLKGAEEGCVVTRFPPEPSGYLHIGHAKAAMLNYYFAQKYKGRMLVRFDDTNPSKEKDEYVDSIMEDLKSLNIKYDELSYTSDYFDVFQEYAVKLIKKGVVYCDDTDVETMRKQRGEGIESEARNNTIEKNLELFEEMIKGTPVGVKNCVRAKMDMKNKNKCLRDPVFYRCVTNVPHHRTGDKYKAYPTYEFACPIVDSLQGVTHSLRTNEYSDRIPLYYWVLEMCELKHVEIYEFSRMNFIRTTLSKRKLRWFVENKYVNGWDDPRMPTVKGILRRGLKVQSLFEFILDQGPSKSVNLMEWDKLWAKNKQIIDPVAPRYVAVASNCVVMTVKNYEEPEQKKRPLHPKNADLGETDLAFGDKVIVEKEDFDLIEENEEVTLMKWGNAYVNKEKRELTLNLKGDFKLTKKKIHWLPVSETLVECELVEYGHLLKVDKVDAELLVDDDSMKEFLEPVTEWVTKAVGEIGLANLEKGKGSLQNQMCTGTVLQLERKSYYIVDETTQSGKLVLVQIPDGKVAKTKQKK
nr:glutamyl-tRNA synthetase [Theileria orientalis]